MKAFLVLGFFAIACTAGAADFRPPPGCETYMTIQSRGCEVSNYYRCEADQPGHQWRVDFGINGKSYQSKTDSEARWLESFSYSEQLAEQIDSEPDPASLTGLLATSRDTYDFYLTNSARQRLHVVGYDKLTGEEVVIDGVTLKRTEFSLEQTDDFGNLVRRIKGSEYVYPDERTFIGGTSTFELSTGETFPVDGTPKDFIFPGQPGFGSTVPLYECSDMMSSLDALTEDRS
jgi:hypothetical protein